MNYLPIVLLSIVLHVQCRSLPSSKFKTLKENEINFDEERSARVHRVADDGYSVVSLGNDRSYIPISGTVEKVISDKISEYPDNETEYVLPGEHKLEKILSAISQQENNINEHDQRNAEIIKKIMQIFKDLPGGESSKLKNFNVKISKIKDTIGQAPHTEYVSNSIDTWRNIVDSPEELNIYYQDNQVTEEHVKPEHDDLSQSSSISHFGLLEGNDNNDIENGEQRLGNMLMNVQSQMKRIRNDFEKLCRKHHIDDANGS